MLNITCHSGALATEEEQTVLTCEVAQAQLSQAVVAVPPVVEEDGQRVAAVVQLGAPDNPEVLQRQIVELVEGHQHVAGHFSDGL